MWQSTVWRGSPPSSSTMSSTRCPSRNQPGRWTISGRPVRAWARAAPRSDFSSSGVKSRRDADLADQADARRRRCHRAPRRTISSAMASTDMRRRPGRVRALQVVARAHDDVQAGGLADPRAAPPGCGRCRGRSGSTTVRPPACAKGQQLGDRQRLVVERAVVEVDERVHAAARRGCPDARARSARCWRSGSLGAVPPAAAVVEDVLVRAA